MQKCFKSGLCLIAKCGAVILVEKKKAFALKSMGRWLLAQLLCDLSDPTQGLTLSVLTFLLHRTKIVVLPQWQTWQMDPFLFKCSNSRCSYPFLHKMENAKRERASHPSLPWEGWSYFDVLVKKNKEPIQGFNDQLIATSEFNIIHTFDNLFRGAWLLNITDRLCNFCAERLNFNYLNFFPFIIQYSMKTVGLHQNEQLLQLNSATPRKRTCLFPLIAAVAICSFSSKIRKLRQVE